MLRDARSHFVASIDDRPDLERALARHVIARLGQARVVAAYVANGSEIDPAPLSAALTEQDVTIALPHVVDRDSPMRFLRWAPGDPLETGLYGLSQPRADAAEVEPDLILAPLVGFDRAMRRLGQGAAFYDRAFARFPRARRIGLAWSVQEADALPADPWDVPLHAVATEKEWIEPAS